MLLNIKYAVILQKASPNISNTNMQTMAGNVFPDPVGNFTLGATALRLEQHHMNSRATSRLA